MGCFQESFLRLKLGDFLYPQTIGYFPPKTACCMKHDFFGIKHGTK